MTDTLLPYSKTLTENNILSIFGSFRNKRIETINNVLEKLKSEEVS
jgi:hypothetical protein